MKKLRLLLAVAFASTALAACQSSLVAPDGDGGPPPVPCEDGYEWNAELAMCTKPTSNS